MPNQQLPRPESDALRRGRRAVRQVLDSLNAEAERVKTAGRHASATSALLQEVEQEHPELAVSNLGRVAVYTILLVVAVAALVFDIFLFNSTAEFYARRAFPDSPIFVGIARLALPVALLFVELAVALFLHLSREEAQETESRGNGYYGWVLVGVLLIMVMPTAVIATQLAMRPPDLDALREASLNWQLTSLVVLSVASHSVILFSGRRGHDAKVWLLFEVRHFWLARAVARHERHKQQAALRVQAAYTRYLSLREAHNAIYSGQAISSGPFTKSAREVLRDLAGYDVIVFSDARSSPGADASHAWDPAGGAPTPGSPPPPSAASLPPPNPSDEPGDRQADSVTYENPGVREADSEIKA